MLGRLTSKKKQIHAYNTKYQNKDSCHGCTVQQVTSFGKHDSALSKGTNQ